MTAIKQFQTNAKHSTTIWSITELHRAYTSARSLLWFAALHRGHCGLIADFTNLQFHFTFLYILHSLILLSLQRKAGEFCHRQHYDCLILLSLWYHCLDEISSFQIRLCKLLLLVQQLGKASCFWSGNANKPTF